MGQAAQQQQPRARQAPAEAEALVHDWRFERGAGNSSSVGGYIVDPRTGTKFGITGTADNGDYIGPEALNARGMRAPNNVQCPKFALKDPQKLIEIFGLQSDQDGRFVRRGFSGYYYLQQERDGTYSIFYDGGTHQRGGNTPAQTFHHGRWDVERHVPARRVMLPPKDQDPAERAPLQTNSPEAATPTAAMQQQIHEPAQPFAELKWPSEIGAPIADSYHAEAEAVSRTMSTAGALIPPELQAQLHELYKDKNLEAGSRALTEAFRDTIRLANDAVSRGTDVRLGGSDLASRLGIAGSSKVFLALAGDNSLSGTEQNLAALEAVFKDTLRAHKIDTQDAVVTLQAYRDPKSGTHLLRMSVIPPYAEGENAKVLTFDAQYIPQLFSNVSARIDRNPKPTEQDFGTWAAEHQRWTGNSSDPTNATPFVKTLIEQQQLHRQHIEEARVASQKAAEERDAALKEAGKQNSTIMAKRGNEYIMGHNGWTIIYRPDNNASMSAIDERTGTITRNPSAGLQFELIDPSGKKQSIRLQSIQHLEGLPQAEREVIERALTTPCEKNTAASVSRIVDLFPSDIYKPGWAASFVFSPRSYSRELTQELSGIYDQKKSAEAEHAFLANLLESLKKKKSISASVKDEVVSEFQ